MSKFLLTGSASGIGAALQQRLLSMGHTVIGVDLQGADIRADLSTADGRVQGLALALERCEGTLDGLVCSAGLGPAADPAAIVSVNYFGALAFLDGLLPALRGGTQTAAVVVSSTGAVQLDAAHHPLTQALRAGDEAQARALATQAETPLVPYCVTKYAITCAVRERAMAWGQAGVRLNAVAPGPIQTPLLQAFLEDKRYPPESSGFLPPLGRRGQPAEVAGFIQFLLSQEAGFIHGAMLFIDGGIDALVRPHSF